MRDGFVCAVVAASLLSLVMVGVAPVMGATGVDSGAIAAAQAETDTFLLASGRNFPDALSGAVLSYAYDAPILLTEADRLPDEIAARIEAQGASRVIVLGGETAIGPEVVSALEPLGVTEVVRLAGPNRFATSAVIAEHAVQALAEAHAARIAEVEAIVAEAVAVLQSQVDALTPRVADVETGAADLESRVAALEGGGSDSGPLESIEASITDVTGVIWSISDAAVVFTIEVTATVDGVGPVRTTISNSHVYTIARLPYGDFFDTGASTTSEGALQAQVDLATGLMPGPGDTVSGDVYLDFYGKRAFATYTGPCTAYLDLR